MVLSWILSAGFFIWELVGLRSGLAALHGAHDPVAAVLFYVRMVFVLICIPSLWVTRLLMFVGWLPSDEWESPNVLQMRMFAWTLNAVLTIVVLLRLASRFMG